MSGPPPFRVLATGLQFPEGPAFAPDGDLWFVELNGGCLTRLGADGLHRYQVGGKPNGLAIGSNGKVVFCDADANALRCLDAASGDVDRLLADDPAVVLDRPNDLAFDAAGRLVFTCPGDSRVDPTGRVWVATAGGTTRLLADGLNFPNGLAFSADGCTLYVAETYRQRVWRGGYDPSAGEWLDPEPFAELGGPIGPDGMAVGEDGALYVAVFGQGAIKRVDPDGRIDIVAAPGPRPTNCAFDPARRLGLVVTEAEFGQVLAFPSLGRGAPLFGGWI